MHPSSAPPLSAYPLFESHDLDETRDEVAKVFCPHRLELIGSSHMAARHNRYAGESVSLNFIDYGAKTLIAPGRLEHFYLLQIPLAGAASISHGKDEVISTRKRASLLNPHKPTTMIWAEQCQMLLLQIDKKALEQQFVLNFGFHPKEPIEFACCFDFTRDDTLMLWRLLRFLMAELDAGHEILAQTSPMRKHYESILINALLDLQTSNYAHVTSGQALPAGAPRQLQLAQDFMHASCAEPLSLNDIARASGTNIRSLQKAFQEHTGMSPMQYLRNLRLEKSHAELLGARDGDNVTNIALRNGFTHLGRFSKSYKEKYGVRPQQAMKNGADLGDFFS